MKRANRTKYAVLGILSMGPHSGYDLKKFCEEVLVYFWHESYGQIYPLLHSLESDGLIRKQRGSDANKDRRIAYVLTAAGRKELSAWLALPYSEQPPRNELLLKVFFSGLVGPDVAITQIEAYESAQKELRTLLEQALKGIESEATEETQSVYWKLTVSLGLRLCAARMAWCREARQVLKGLSDGATS